MVNIFTGEPVECRRSRLKCAGVHACEELDKGSYHTERFELDPSSLRDFVDAQINSRLEEGDTREASACVRIHYFDRAATNTAAVFSHIANHDSAKLSIAKDVLATSL